MEYTFIKTHRNVCEYAINGINKSPLTRKLAQFSEYFPW